MSENCNCGCGGHEHHAEEESKYDFIINEYKNTMSDKEIEEKVKKLISKGRLGLTTKLEAPVEDNDYLEEKYKKMIDSIELPDDEKLPESFIDAVNRAASEPTKLEPKDEPKDGPME